MNLLWHRVAQETGQGRSIDPVNEGETAHWAETILKRLVKTDDIAAPIRSAFPTRALGEIFEIFDILHVPGRSLKILGRFYSNPATQALTIVQVNFFSALEIIEEFNKSKDLAIDGARIALLESWDGIVRIFPEDSGLPGLGDMLDLNKVAKLLGETPPAANEADWKLLSYQSGKRCALGYSFKESGMRYFGKIQDERRAETTHNHLCHLWRDPKRRFQIPKPIAYDPRLGARWETFVDGENLEKALETGELTDLVKMVIDNLVSLHEQTLPDLPAATAEQILTRIEKKILRRMHSLVPELAVRAETIIRRLNDCFSWTNNSASVTLHGDFHIANFILNNEGLVFIDLDSLCKGDPCIDLALFGSRLMLRNLHNNDRLEETLQSIANLPDLYMEFGGNNIRHDTFAWYLSALLIGRQIKSCMRVDAPDIVVLISKLLDWAEDSLNYAQKTKIVFR